MQATMQAQASEEIRDYGLLCNEFTELQLLTRQTSHSSCANPREKALDSLHTDSYRPLVGERRRACQPVSNTPMRPVSAFMTSL